jgi:hypothetical protein
MTVAGFVSFFCQTHKGCEPGTVVTRIEWRYADPPDSAPGAAGQETPVRAEPLRSEP